MDYSTPRPYISLQRTTTLKFRLFPAFWRPILTWEEEWLAGDEIVIYLTLVALLAMLINGRPTNPPQARMTREHKLESKCFTLIIFKLPEGRNHRLIDDDDDDDDEEYTVFNWGSGSLKFGVPTLFPPFRTDETFPEKGIPLFPRPRILRLLP